MQDIAYLDRSAVRGLGTFTFYIFWLFFKIFIAFILKIFYFINKKTKTCKVIYSKVIDDLFFNSFIETFIEGFILLFIAGYLSLKS